jgi:hypothetical protein
VGAGTAITWVAWIGALRARPRHADLEQVHGVVEFEHVDGIDCDQPLCGARPDESAEEGGSANCDAEPVTERGFREQQRPV